MVINFQRDAETGNDLSLLITCAMNIWKMAIICQRGTNSRSNLHRLLWLFQKRVCFGFVKKVRAKEMAPIIVLRLELELET